MLRNAKGQFVKGNISWSAQNKGRYHLPACTEETKEKIRKAVSKPRVEKVCGICETMFSVWPSLKNQKYCSKSCGIKSRSSWNKGLKGYRSGEKHWNWRGGVSTINSVIRNSLEYKAWRMSVFERDGYKCTSCGKGNSNGERTVLNADHIKPFALYPELRLSIDNGRTLCVPCHRKTDTWGVKLPVSTSSC